MDSSIRSLTGNGMVCGKSHDVIVTEFVDKYFIIVSDNGKIGTLVQVLLDKNTDKDRISFDSKVLFGRDEPEVHGMAQSIVEELKISKPVIFGFSSKECNSTTAVNIRQLIANTLLQSKKENVPNENIFS